MKEPEFDSEEEDDESESEGMLLCILFYYSKLQIW